MTTANPFAAAAASAPVTNVNANAAGFADPASTLPATPVGDPFADPTGGSGEKVADLLGMLVLVTPTEYVEGMQTDIGVSNAVRADVVLLDGPRQGEAIDNMLFFQRALSRDLLSIMRNPQASMLIGRIGKGEAKAGKSAPYLFSKATEDEKNIARQYLATRNK
jgi:hypothetical protein